MMQQIEPSLLAYRPEEIEKSAYEFKKLGIEFIHYDVMDGIFVPNTAFGTEYMELLNTIGLKINVHLMVDDVQKYLNDFIKFLPYSITFHVENMNGIMVNNFLHSIRSNGIKCGVAIKPGTLTQSIEKYLDSVDFITVMGVEPGFGGQKYIIDTTDKLMSLKEYKIKHNLDYLIQLDGGVTTEIIEDTKSYVDHYVSGTFFKNIADKVALLKTIFCD